MEQQNNWITKVAIFLTSQTISLFGSSIVAFAIVWHIALETSSGSFMMISIMCSFLPQVLISLFAGVWADRYNRKALIMLADLFIAVATLILALYFISGVQSMTMLFAVSVIRSIGAGVQTPAVGAILPQLVPADKLTKVNGINSAFSSILLLVSPAVGGLLLATVGFAYVLLVDVVTALLAVAIMLFLKVQKHESTAEPASAIEELKAGIAYSKNNLLIKKLLIFYLLFFFLITPAAFLTPIMIERSFGPEVWRLTASEIFWTLGSLIGGVFVSVWGGLKNRIATMALSSLGFGVTFGLLGFATNFYVFLVIILISGIFMPVFNTAETVLIQENVEESMMGRVFSIVQIIASTAIPCGMLVFGPLADIMKVEYILIATGIVLALLSLYIFKNQDLIKQSNQEDS
ncbi:MFS transporter [Oscillospiraceae bacterium PP1C4]